MALIQISIAVVRCNSTEDRASSDHLYYISTLRPGPPVQRPELERPIQVAGARVSSVLEINDGEDKTFDSPYDVVFPRQDCNPEGAVVGSLYFIGLEGDPDVPLDQPRLDLVRLATDLIRRLSRRDLERAEQYGAITGLIIGIVAAMVIVPASVITGQFWGILVALAGLGLLPLLGMLLGRAIAHICNGVDNLFTQATSGRRDDFIGGVALSVPVLGQPDELVPGSPFRLSAATRGTSGTTEEIPLAGTQHRFAAANGRVDYQVSLRVERGRR